MARTFSRTLSAPMALLVFAVVSIPVWAQEPTPDSEGAQPADASVPEVSFEIFHIAQPEPAWVSSYWGYNAPKIVFDGEAFYTVNLWGEHGNATGILYRIAAGKVEAGYSWHAGYQPGLVLLDGQGRLILVCSQMSAPPLILRSTAPGDIHHFEAIPVPDMARAGYVGAAMDGHRLVLGVVGDPNTYSFLMLVIDLETGEFTGPEVLSEFVPGARPQEESWLYPVIVPTESGYHLMVSDNGDEQNSYYRVLHARVKRDLTMIGEPDVLAAVPRPWNRNWCFGHGMIEGPGGWLYASATVTLGEPGPCSPDAARLPPRTGTRRMVPRRYCGGRTLLPLSRSEESTAGVVEPRLLVQRAFVLFRRPRGKLDGVRPGFRRRLERRVLPGRYPPLQRHHHAPGPLLRYQRSAPPGLPYEPGPIPDPGCPVGCARGSLSVSPFSSATRIL